VGQAFGVDQVMGEFLPDQREKWIRELRRKNRKVARVGDGINEWNLAGCATLSRHHHAELHRHACGRQDGRGNGSTDGGEMELDFGRIGAAQMGRPAQGCEMLPLPPACDGAEWTLWFRKIRLFCDACRAVELA
jgi:hypothetical protein